MPQQLRAELFADDLSRGGVVALERRGEDALEVPTAFEATYRCHCSEADGLASVARRLFERSAPPGLRRRRAEQPRIRLHEVRDVDRIEPVRLCKKGCHLSSRGGAQNRLLLEDPVERRDQQPPIGGRGWPERARPCRTPPAAWAPDDGPNSRAHAP